MAETSYGKFRYLSVKWEFSKLNSSLMSKDDLTSFGEIDAIDNYSSLTDDNEAFYEILTWEL